MSSCNARRRNHEVCVGITSRKEGPGAAILARSFSLLLNIPLDAK